jgi:hypothetical protein
VQSRNNEKLDLFLHAKLIVAKAQFLRDRSHAAHFQQWRKFTPLVGESRQEAALVSACLVHGQLRVSPKGQKEPRVVPSENESDVGKTNQSETIKTGT